MLALGPMVSPQTQPVGNLLRDWRRRRRLSQLDLACEAEISTRHLSFLETGRSSPSREMVLRLAEQLGVPLRERNQLLIAAGFAPIFQERTLDDPTLRAARQVVELVLAGHEPFPALAVDRHWTLVASNCAVAPLLAGIESSLLAAPVNVLRLSLHPRGLAPRIVNLGEWRTHLLARLRRQIDASADPILRDLLNELSGYPMSRENEHSAATDIDRAGTDRAGTDRAGTDYAGVAVPLRLAAGNKVLSFLSTTTVFGTPVDITLSELALESFFPADATTAEALHRLAQAGRTAVERLKA